MNLNQLWSGNDYAWYEWKGRGETYRSNARRVKIIRVYKRQIYGNERESGFAEVMLLEKDGTPITNGDGSQRTTEVRARDVAMRWDAYEEEHNHREAKRIKEEAERQADYERRKAERQARLEAEQKEREEREAKELADRNRLVEAMANKWGIPRDAINNVTSTTILLNRATVEKELGVQIVSP